MRHLILLPFFALLAYPAQAAEPPPLPAPLAPQGREVTGIPRKKAVPAMNMEMNLFQKQVNARLLVHEREKMAMEEEAKARRRARDLELLRRQEESKLINMARTSRQAAIQQHKLAMKMLDVAIGALMQAREAQVNAINAHKKVVDSHKAAKQASNILIEAMPTVNKASEHAKSALHKTVAAEEQRLSLSKMGMNLF